MREYITAEGALDIFEQTYDEALSVAFATGSQPERMLVDPVPPGWAGHTIRDEAYEMWLCDVMRSYGDLKPSMLQDFERSRTTEIDFINEFVVERGRTCGVPTPVNAAIVETVQAITRGCSRPRPELLAQMLERLRRR